MPRHKPTDKELADLAVGAPWWQQELATNASDLLTEAGRVWLFDLLDAQAFVD